MFQGDRMDFYGLLLGLQISALHPYTVCLKISSLETPPPGNGGHLAMAPLSNKFTSASRRVFMSMSRGLGKPRGTPVASRKENAAR
mmetsp:Transcript_13472/g.27372  ORF Transcript_13472/g.27372 Transcript_13472/m.27372 type:complete len:86 (-) Transcript_13472:1424-1681(-)